MSRKWRCTETSYSPSAQGSPRSLYRPLHGMPSAMPHPKYQNLSGDVSVANNIHVFAGSIAHNEFKYDGPCISGRRIIPRSETNGYCSRVMVVVLTRFDRLYHLPMESLGTVPSLTRVPGVASIQAISGFGA